ncbi:hypothetical protein DBR06_SOUSAS8310139, partial [Sousa chinensis]
AGSPLCGWLQPTADFLEEAGHFTSISLLLALASSPFKKAFGASLVAQWLRVRLPMQGTRVLGQRCEDYITHNASRWTPTRPRPPARRRLSQWSSPTVPGLPAKGFGPRFWPAEPSTPALPLPSQPAAPGLPRAPPRVSALPVSAGAGAGSQLELLSAALARRSLSPENIFPSVWPEV